MADLKGVEVQGQISPTHDEIARQRLAEGLQDGIQFRVRDGLPEWKIETDDDSSFSKVLGAKGDKGDPGADGRDGADGKDGAAATIEAGTVTMLPAGSTPRVDNSGTNTAAVFNFYLPMASGGTGDGTGGGTGGGSGDGGLYAFEIRSDGCLYIINDDDTPPSNFYINADGNLIAELV